MPKATTPGSTPKHRRRAAGVECSGGGAFGELMAVLDGGLPGPSPEKNPLLVGEDEQPQQHVDGHRTDDEDADDPEEFVALSDSFNGLANVWDPQEVADRLRLEYGSGSLTDWVFFGPSREKMGKVRPFGANLVKVECLPHGTKRCGFVLAYDVGFRQEAIATGLKWLAQCRHVTSCSEHHDLRPFATTAFRAHVANSRARV